MQYIYIISKNNISLDEIYSQISYAIDTQKFNDLVDVVNQFVHLYSRQSNQLYHTIFTNKVITFSNLKIIAIKFNFYLIKNELTISRII